MEILSESGLEEHFTIFKEFAQQHPRLKNSNDEQIKQFFLGHITNPMHVIYIKRDEQAIIQQFALAMMHDDYESAWHLGIGYQLKESTYSPDILLEKKTQFFLDIIEFLQKMPSTKIINIGGHFKEVELDNLLETKGFKFMNRRKMKIVKDSLNNIQNFPPQMQLIPWNDKYSEEISQLCLDFSKVRADNEIFPYFHDLQSTQKFTKKIKENAWGDFYPELSFILLDNEKPIGICFITEFNPDFGCIPYFGVHPDYQKKGLGSKLLSNSLLNVFDLKKKWDRVELDVTQGIPAEKLYEKVGFESLREYTMFNWNRV